MGSPGIGMRGWDPHPRVGDWDPWCGTRTPPGSGCWAGTPPWGLEIPGSGNPRPGVGLGPPPGSGCGTGTPRADRGPPPGWGCGVGGSRFGPSRPCCVRAGRAVPGATKPRLSPGSGRCHPGSPPGIRDTGGPWVTPPRRQAAPVPRAEAMAEEQDVRFVTEESFDFSFVSPSDSREEEDEDEDKDIPGAASGRWSPLSGARLEEMVREATRLAAQLEQCHLPPQGTPPTPRSPRRQTFVVKDSPVRALLPTVESPPAASRTPPAKPRGPPAATNVPSTRKVPSSCHPAAVPKGPPGARVPPPSRMGPPRPCPPQGQGAGTRGKAEPPRAGTAGQTKARGGTAPAPPATRQPRTRATTVPVPSGHPPATSATPRTPGRTPAGGAAAGGRASAPRGAGAARAAPPATGSVCKPGPPPSRLRPPRKTAMSSTPR
ncbi:proline/serine-rich coiled-coil protein 1 isoform X2 [Caloenas nicobarica]|uniref:proline/serine-rich coiled-coil protein 1 isoform X2 n=1 Tax=Caloenas nicobarica TaxID=187106 RepID=UPI0032B7201D